MSPDERIDRLVTEVVAELDRIDRAAADLRAAASGLTSVSDSAHRMAVAGCLHGFYTGCEAVLARIARLVGDMPAGHAWHHALLFGATAPVPGVRPPVIPPATATLLEELLRFRHFFRSSYGVELDVSKLTPLAATALEARRIFRNDIEVFLQALRASGK